MKKKLDVKNYGLKCSYCSEIFFPKSASSYGAYKKLLNKGKNIFCSKDCREKYDKDMKTPCLNCGKMTIGKFCNSSCSATYNNKRRKVTDNHKLKTSLKIKARYCAIREMLNLPLTKSLNNNIKKGLIDKEMVNDYKKILTEKDLLDYSKNIYKLDRLVTPEDVLKKCPICGKLFNQKISNSVTCSQKCGNIIISKKRIKKIMNEGSTCMPTYIGDYTYKNFTVRCESKLEVAALKVLIDDFKIISISRCDFSLPYTDTEGIERRYYPDFVASDGNLSYLIEVKEIEKQCKRLDKYAKNLSIKEKLFYDYCEKNNLTPLWMTRESISNLEHVYKETLKELSHINKRKKNQS